MKTAGLLPAASETADFLIALLFTCLLTVALARERLFYALLLARFEVKGVPLHLFDDVLGLHLALKATQGILERLTFLNANLCQSNTPQFLPSRN